MATWICNIPPGIIPVIITQVIVTGWPRQTVKRLLLKADQMQQSLPAKTKKVILRIERAAMEGKLSDEDWEMLERLVDRFEKG